MEIYHDARYMYRICTVNGDERNIIKAFIPSLAYSGDFIRCPDCGTVAVVPHGAEDCPICGKCSLMWAGSSEAVCGEYGLTFTPNDSHPEAIIDQHNRTNIIIP